MLSDGLNKIPLLPLKSASVMFEKLRGYGVLSESGTIDFPRMIMVAIVQIRKNT